MMNTDGMRVPDGECPCEGESLLSSALSLHHHRELRVTSTGTANSIGTT